MIRKFLLAAICFVLATSGVNPATTLLPNGMQCFSGANGNYANGSMNMFVPNTTTVKNTWQDANQTTLNTAPIQLDANGCATIYGVGSYRQQLYDGPVVAGVTTGNLIWDKVTTDTSSYNSVFMAGLAGGTPNAITINYPGFTTTSQIISFTALQANTGPTTLNPGSGAIPIVKDTVAGPVALTGGEIQANNEVVVQFDPTSFSYHILNLITAAASTAQAPLCGAINMRITNNAVAPNSTMDVTADAVVMLTTTGSYVSRSNISASLNLTLSGVVNGLDARDTFSASTWYNVWMIDNGVTTGAFASNVTHGTAPQLPSGYSYKCRMGAIFVGASGNLARTRQQGRDAQYVVSSSETVTLRAMSIGAVGTYNRTTTNVY